MSAPGWRGRGDAAREEEVVLDVGEEGGVGGDWGDWGRRGDEGLRGVDGMDLRC